VLSPATGQRAGPHVSTPRRRSVASEPLPEFIPTHRVAERAVKQRNNTLTLAHLSEQLEGACKGRVVHFGSCSTLDVNGHELNNFLRRTRSCAVFGFRTDVDWLLPATFDLLVLGYLQDVSFRKPGMGKLGPHGRSVQVDFDGPLLDVESVHLRLAAEVVSRHVRVAGRRLDHDEPEGGPAGGGVGRLSM